MKFGGKHTIQSRAAAAEKRLGKTTGVSKGAPAKQDWKARPKISAAGGGTIGLTFTKRTGKSK